MPHNEQPIKSAIASKLKAYRKENHLTQREMAVKIGTTMRVYQSIEEARSLPRIRVVATICRLLGETLDELFHVST